MVPPHHSNASARAKLFLDFDGHYEARWGDKQNVRTPVFDLDGNPRSFSGADVAAIDEIWARVSEDFAPFNIDVTTVDPGSYPHGVVALIAIGGDYSDWYGEEAGGVAYVTGFAVGSAAPNVGYVFSETLDNVPNVVADAVSHEAGHLLGLNHQSVWSSTYWPDYLQDEYNPGNSAWAPLMGVSYDAERSTWHNGTPDTLAGVTQDDMAMIAGAENGFGYRPDDYADAPQDAALLPVTGTTISVSGLIGQTDDQDIWRFTTVAGTVSFSLTGAAYGSNLDGVLELRDASGSVVASSNPFNSLGASLSANVAAGTYYLVARGSGDYGDVGQYTITGTLPSPVTEIDVSVDGVAMMDDGSIDFGNTAVGIPVIRTITISNASAAPLTLTWFNEPLPAGFTLVADLDSTLVEAGESASFSVRLDAAAAGIFFGNLTLLSDDVIGGCLRFGLRGNVGPLQAPEIELQDHDVMIADSGTLNFGSVTQGHSRFKTITAINQGGSALSLTPLIAATMPSGFTLVSNPGTTSLAPGQATFFVIRLDATAVGLFTGTVHVLSNDSDETSYDLQIAGVVTLPSEPDINLSLEDLGIEPQSVSDGAMIDLGSTVQGGSIGMTITVTNLGSTRLSLTPLGSANISSNVSLVSNIDSTSLAPGEKTSFKILFHGTAPGPSSGALHVVSSDSDESAYDVSFQALVTAPLQQVLDDGDETTLLVGNWRSAGFGYARDAHYTSKGSGTRYAQWRFTQSWGVGLATGYYRVYATWTWNKHNASNAPYAIFDGDHLYYHHQIGFARVNQRVAPGPKTSIGRWRYLDTVYISTGVLEVTLTNTANGYITADAVRIEQISSKDTFPIVYNVMGSAGMDSNASASGSSQASAGTLNLSATDGLPLPLPATTNLVSRQTTAFGSSPMTASGHENRAGGMANAKAADGTDPLSNSLDLLESDERNA